MIVENWHRWVQQPKKSRSWHERDIADELRELSEAHSPLHRWSEMSDVVYTVTRARWSGHDLSYPISRQKIALGYIYMYPKYTSRVLFFRRAGKKLGASKALQSVRNPRKAHKLAAIAGDNQLDPKLFSQVCERQLKYWLLLP